MEVANLIKTSKRTTRAAHKTGGLTLFSDLGAESAVSPQASGKRAEVARIQEKPFHA
jgi:hypothetical protein